MSEVERWRFEAGGDQDWYQALQEESKRKFRIQQSEVVEAQEHRTLHERLRRRAEQERDAARAEVERLRGRLKQIEIHLDSSRSDAWKAEESRAVVRLALGFQPTQQSDKWLRCEGTKEIPTGQGNRPCLGCVDCESAPELRGEHG